MTAVAGLRGTGNWGADERPKDFREMILWRNPNGSAPITALMARAQKSAVSDPEFNWWDEPVDIFRLQVNGALGTGDETIVVDSLDPDATNPDRVYGTATHLKRGDILQVESEAAAYNNELLEVVTVISDTQFTVKRGAAGTTAAAISDNAFLLKIGSAYAEGTPAADAVSRNPIKYNNYCQIFKTSYELTGTAEVTSTRTGDPLKNDKRRKMSDHSIDLEQALLWGVKNETTGANGKPLRYTDGLRSFIPASNVTIFAAAVTTSTFLDAVSPVFEYSSQAGDERVVFCGNTFLNEWNKIVQAAGDIQLGAIINQYGLNLREYIMPQGSLFFKRHPLMNRNALYQKSAFIVDFSALRWRHTKGRDTHFEDNIQLPGEDLRKGQWFTEGGLEVWYGGLTCGYIGNMSAT
ncbi:MAG: hypothetical protein GTO00_09150 [Deltaproteobacteria bacterium]|nr:hypothetical protein [Deltaproteobacteria bacterium]